MEVEANSFSSKWMVLYTGGQLQRAKQNTGLNVASSPSQCSREERGRIQTGFCPSAPGKGSGAGSTAHQAILQFSLQSSSVTASLELVVQAQSHKAALTWDRVAVSPVPMALSLCSVIARMAHRAQANTLLTFTS